MNRLWPIFSFTALVAFAGCHQPQPRITSPGPSADPPAASQAPAIDAFQGDYRFLSNFWPARVVYEGINYPTVEHAYQAAKTLKPTERRRISLLPTPGDAKRAGRAAVQRPDWEKIKLQVMEDCVRYKFTRHAELRDQLLATGDAPLIEGNTWNDTFWGVCGGRGENHLGKILMKVRDELRRLP